MRQMSFEELYEPCFRHISLLKVGQAQSKENAEEKTTLEHIFSTSQFVTFLLTSGARGLDTAKKLDHLVKKQNEKGREKSQNSPARLRRLFSMKKKKKKETGEGVTVSVVVVNTEYGSTGTGAVSVPSWFICPTLTPSVKGRLMRSLGFEFPPSVIVVDTVSRSISTTEGRRMLHEDPTGVSFPWWPPSAADLLKGPLLRRTDGVVTSTDYSELKAEVRGLLFGAHWCPPSRIWTKQLGPVYQSLMDKEVLVELIFCSSDRSVENFDQYVEQMPWVAFPYDTAMTSALTRLYNVNGIPSLILIDKEGRVISRHGKSTLLGDPEGQCFPWGPQPIYELDEHSVCRLRDEPSLILFTEGSPEDVQFSLSVLDEISRKLFDERLKIDEKRGEERDRRLLERENVENGNSLSKSSSNEECASMSSVDVTPVASPPDLLQIFYTGEDPICDHILEKILGLGDAELPLLCIIDGMAGQMTVCEHPDVSEEVLEEFVAGFRSGQLKFAPLPAASEGRTVGGIPTAAIEQAIAASPSQNSIGNEEQRIAI